MAAFCARCSFAAAIAKSAHAISKSVFAFCTAIGSGLRGPLNRRMCGSLVIVIFSYGTPETPVDKQADGDDYSPDDQKLGPPAHWVVSSP